MGEPHPDLHFDHAAARAAINELTAVINLLRTQTHNRATKAKDMGPPNWTGTYSEQFYNSELTRMTDDAGTLIGKLQALITTISNASTTANTYAQENAAWHKSNDPQLIPSGVPQSPPSTSNPPPTPAPPGPAPTPPPPR